MFRKCRYRVCDKGHAQGKEPQHDDDSSNRDRVLAGVRRRSIMTRFQISILVPVMFAGALAVAAPARAQMSESELVMRINRLENQVRQLTGTNEQLQYRNQQLEEQLARLQQGGAPPAQARGPAASAPQAQYAPPPQP